LKSWYKYQVNILLLKAPEYCEDTLGLLWCRNEIIFMVGRGLAPAANPQKSVATVSCREGVYKRAGEPSVIFEEKEELRSE